MGGETSNGAGATVNNIYDRVHIYNLASNTWRLGMRTARHGVFPVLYSGRIYVAGGGIQSGNSQSAIMGIIYNPDGTCRGLWLFCRADKAARTRGAMDFGTHRRSETWRV
jgi:hypothetical protein